VTRRPRLLWNRASLLIPAVAACCSAFPAGAATAADGMQDALLAVTLDGVSEPAPVSLLRDAAGHFYAPAEQFAQWRLDWARLPAVVHDGVRYFDINAIPGSVVEVDEARQELHLKIPARMLRPTRIPYAPVEIGEEVMSGTGVFLNYELSAEASDGKVRAGGMAEAALFTPAGVGTARFVARTSGSGSGVVRLDTNWTIDDPGRMRSLRLGDSISVGGPGASPIRFGGIQIASNFALQPGFVTFPMPSLNGSAELPSIADLYVNGVLARSSAVRPGPFEMTDIPVVAGNGNVQLVVRDMLGRQQVVSGSYYASPMVLRQGLHDYSYEIGFLRGSYGVRSNDYGKLMLSASHRYGFTNWLTGEAHVAATDAVQQLSAGANVTIAGVGEIGGALAASRSGRGDGYWASLDLQRRSRGFSFGLHAELSSGKYAAVGETPGEGRPESLIEGFAGIELGKGSLGISYLRRDGRTDADPQLISLSWSTRLGRLGSLSLAGRTAVGGGKDNAANLTLVIPLQGRTSASAGLKLEDGTAGLEASLQRMLPSGSGVGYRLEAATGRFDRVDSRIALRTNFADYEAQLTWIDKQTGVRLSTTGAIGLVDGRWFASRQLGQSFAEVRVGNYAGVRVYADNQLVGRTNRDGSLIVDRLRAYQSNSIRIDAADLPMDAEISTDRKSVTPRDRSGVVVTFDARPSRASLMKVMIADGEALPTGSIVRVDGLRDQFVSAPGGEVYIPFLESRAVAVAEWNGGKCRFEVKPVRNMLSEGPIGVRCAREIQ
jgi:outer membrane usher protein